MTFTIIDAEAGNKIESCKTMKKAEAIVAKYEEQDRKDGTYEAGFYDIISE